MEGNKFTIDESFLTTEYTSTSFKIYTILKAYSENKDKGLRVAKEYIKTRKAYLSFVEHFKKKYVNAEDYLADLEEISKVFDKKEEKKCKTFINNENFKDDPAEKLNFLKKIYDSGLSLMDYFYYNYVPIDFNRFFSYRCDKKDKQALAIVKRNNTTYPLVVQLINKINNDEIDYVGYYETTKLNPCYIVAIAKENNIYTAQLAKFISKLRLNRPVNVEKELNGELVINEQYISRELKEEAIRYLNSIDAPIDLALYNNMVRRLVKKSSK